MRRISMVLLLTVGLGAQMRPALAHGGGGHGGGCYGGWHGGYCGYGHGYGYGCGWWPFALGLGLGFAASYPVYASSHPVYTSPAVVYTYPATTTYVYSQPAVVRQTVPAQPVQPSQPSVAAPSNTAYAATARQYRPAVAPAVPQSQPLIATVSSRGAWIQDTSPDRYIPPAAWPVSQPGNSLAGATPAYAVSQ